MGRKCDTVLENLVSSLRSAQEGVTYVTISNATPSWQVGPTSNVAVPAASSLPSTKLFAAMVALSPSLLYAKLWADGLGAHAYRPCAGLRVRVPFRCRFFKPSLASTRLILAPTFGISHETDILMVLRLCSGRGVQGVAGSNLVRARSGSATPPALCSMRGDPPDPGSRGHLIYLTPFVASGESWGARGRPPTSDEPRGG